MLPVLQNIREKQHHQQVLLSEGVDPLVHNGHATYQGAVLNELQASDLDDMSVLFSPRSVQHLERPLHPLRLGMSLLRFWTTLQKPCHRAKYPLWLLFLNLPCKQIWKFGTCKQSLLYFPALLHRFVVQPLNQVGAFLPVLLFSHSHQRVLTI